MTKQRRVLSEARQMLYALAISFVVYLVAQAVVMIGSNGGEEVQLLAVIMLMWASFAASHAWLAWRTYAGRRGDDLRAALQHTDTGRFGRLAASRGARRLLGIGDVTGFAVQLAIVAVLGVIVLVVNADLRSSLNLGMGAVLVVASWFDAAVAFAVAYARVDLSEGGLDFPGGGEREFADYTYLALAGQATFGTTDVAITSTRLRRTMTVQGLVAFVFNTVVVAMLVSLMLAAAGS